MEKKIQARRRKGVVRDVSVVWANTNPRSGKKRNRRSCLASRECAIKHVFLGAGDAPERVFAVRDCRAGWLYRLGPRLGDEARWREVCSLARARVVCRAAAVAPADMPRLYVDISPVRSATNRFSRPALPPGTVFAVRDRRAGRLDRSDLRLGHDAGWREGCSLARARVVPRQSRRRIRRTGATTNPRKVSTNIGSSKAERSRDAPDFDAIRSPRGRRGYGFA